MKKAEEYEEHIKEMEAMGYDMSAYRCDEEIGGANKRGPDGSYVNAEKRAILEGQGNQPEWNQKKAEEVDRSKPWNNCNKECDICTHTHCPNNQSRRR